MKERRQSTRREWEQITSSRPVVRRVPKPLRREEKERLEEIAAGQLDARLEDEDAFRRWELEASADGTGVDCTITGIEEVRG
jgi:hypothetical protein